MSVPFSVSELLEGSIKLRDVTRDRDSDGGVGTVAARQDCTRSMQVAKRVH